MSKSLFISIGRLRFIMSFIEWGYGSRFMVFFEFFSVGSLDIPFSF